MQEAKTVFQEILDSHNIEPIENGLYRVEFNGKVLAGPISSVLAVINGGETWPAEPMGNWKKKPSQFEQ